VYLRYLESENENGRIDRQEDKFLESRALLSKRGISLIQISTLTNPKNDPDILTKGKYNQPHSPLTESSTSQIPLLY